jgi:hypothetical protein
VPLPNSPLNFKIAKVTAAALIFSFIHPIPDEKDQVQNQGHSQEHSFQEMNNGDIRSIPFKNMAYGQANHTDSQKNIIIFNYHL